MTDPNEVLILLPALRVTRSAFRQLLLGAERAAEADPTEAQALILAELTDLRDRVLALEAALDGKARVRVESDGGVEWVPQLVEVAE